MSAVAVEVVGLEDLLRGFAGIEKAVDNLKPVLEPVGVEALADIQKRFDVAGPGWEPHAESTRKRRVGPSRILWDTGALRDSFAQGAAGNVFRLSDAEMEVGSNIFYGIFHQEGRGHNPVRPIVDVQPEQEEKYSRIASNELVKEIRALGFEVA
jgi:hypothetical protein